MKSFKSNMHNNNCIASESMSKKEIKLETLESDGDNILPKKTSNVY